MAATPAELRARLHNSGFLKETSAWLDKLGAYGTAGGTAVDLQLAAKKGDTGAVTAYWNRLKSGGSTVTPIDTATNTTEPTLLVTGQAYGLALSPDGRTLWVTPSNGDTATPVDTVTGAPGEQVTVGRSAFDVALNWNGTKAYVTTADANALVPIDVVGGKVEGSLRTGAYPLAVALTP